MSRETKHNYSPKFVSHIHQFIGVSSHEVQDGTNAFTRGIDQCDRIFQFRSVENEIIWTADFLTLFITIFNNKFNKLHSTFLLLHEFTKADFIRVY